MQLRILQLFRTSVADPRDTRQAKNHGLYDREMNDLHATMKRNRG
jgi:hypothetical protein